jgi:hypothetical protein
MIDSNLDNNARAERLVFGVILLIGALLGFGRIFLFLIGAILVIEAFVGWCGVPLLVQKLKLDNLFKK